MVVFQKNSKIMFLINLYLNIFFFILLIANDEILYY